MSDGAASLPELLTAGSRPVLWTLAIVFDAGAVAGLALIGYGSYLGFSPGIGVAFLGGLIGLSVVPGLILSCLVVADRLRRARVGRVLIALVLTASIGAAVAAPLTVSAVFSSLTPNPAAVRLQPVVGRLEADGGTRLCDGGDPGLGPDNIRPSKTVVYRLRDRPGLEQQLQQTARRAGIRAAAYPGTRFRVDIDTTTAPVACTSGGPYTPAPGDAMVTVTLDLPSR